MPQPSGPPPASPPPPTSPPASPRAAVLTAGIALTAFGVLALLLALHGWGPFPAESWLHDWAVTHRPGWAVRVAGAVTDLGTGLPPYAAAVAAGVLLARGVEPVRRRIWWICGPALVLAVGQLLRRGLMLLFARPRPPAADWVVASPSGYAFPSGHAFTGALAAGLLAWAVLRTVRRRLAVPLALLLGVVAAAVGLSRVYLGVHWPLDVLGGWLLAVGWFALCLAVILPTLRRTQRATEAPTGPADQGDRGSI
ncbi:phosphatase PAP2 family protein [Kitasatospora sp. NBC_00240]|uniref:phosphatase PAP2 family protein n=1 Tax=Kitasatospora sp. NBC_00240 TaxID=2903567 RepID=UPI00224E3DB9|nr:phosphatase PAP2 family protein [Kitasatospora sp. NBC_00240]MCX5207788.1 phosphatase PAP2 family protein [Kitasatospora sp. NBC_00240]